ncbi:alpha/beta-hydrolase [Phlegmacium glaucopus]|nr:alpha/beta-hydrolase [Phlegmacium glaucopus]
MANAFHRQPLKGLYISYQFITILFIRGPLWALLSIPPSWRPRKTWTIKRTIMAKFIKHVMGMTALTGPLLKMPNHLAILPGKDVQGVWVEAANHLITGDLKIWAQTADVSSVRIPGYWTHKKGTSIKVASPPQPGEKIIYALHGGAYVHQSAHPTDPTAVIVRVLLKHVESVTRVFSLEYRLATGKPFELAHPFPTQLLDALAGYNYLVNVVGFSPNDIIIAGDSAGGNLAHALTLYLTEYKDTTEVALPAPPNALILLSPWVDLGMTHSNLPKGSAKTCLASDYIGTNGDVIHYAKDAFTGPHGRGIAEINSYISPASLDPGLYVDFKKFPRTFIVGGGAEVLIDSIRTLKDRMVRDLGEGNGVKEGEGKVRYFEVPDGIHDYLVFPWHEPERTDTLVEINRWVSAT